MSTPEEYQKWVRDGLPQHAAKILKFFPTFPQCVRLVGQSGHFVIHSFNGGLEGPTVTIVHGSDSSLPGVGVFGVNLEDVLPCDCGTWKPATAEQIEQSRQYIEAMKLLHPPCEDPRCACHQP